MGARRLTKRGMFVGHYSAAFAAAALPKAPKLGTLFVAAQLVDLAFFAFVPMGIEAMRIAPGTSVMNPIDLYHMPYTHSLLGTFVWAAGFAALLRLTIGNWRAGFIGGAVVVSHWFLDLLVHVPDLTLAGTPPKLGLGLWNHPAIEMPLELGLLFGSIWLYARARRAARKSFALPVLIGVLLLVQAINWFGPPPVAVDAGLWGLALFVFALATILASWVARTRIAR
jgi:hypothetical protein